MLSCIFYIFVCDKVLVCYKIAISGANIFFVIKIFTIADTLFMESCDNGFCRNGD